MAKLRAYTHKRFPQDVLVGILDSIDTENCVMFITKDGFIGYGTKEYLEADYEPVDADYEIKITHPQQ